MQQRRQGYDVDYLLNRGNQPKSTLATLSNKEKTKKSETEPWKHGINTRKRVLGGGEMFSNEAHN